MLHLYIDIISFTTILSRLESYVCDPELMLPDPAGIHYMESDTQPPVTVTASEEDEVYSSLEEHYGVTMATKNVVHQLEKTPTTKSSQGDDNPDYDCPQPVAKGDNVVDDLIEASTNDATLQATPTYQEGVATSSSSNMVLNTLSNLWTSAWGSWQS